MPANHKHYLYKGHCFKYSKQGHIVSTYTKPIPTITLQALEENSSNRVEEIPYKVEKDKT